MRWHCAYINDTDRNGDIVARGVEWSEPRVLPELIYIFLAAVGGLYGVGFLLAAPGLLKVLGGLLLLCAGWFNQLKQSDRGRKRRVLFYRDGRITIPFGIHDMEGSAGIQDYKIGDVRSIEINRHQNGEQSQYFVRGTLRDGAVALFTSALEENFALMVTVRLNETLQAVLLDTAETTRGGTGLRGGRPHREPKLVD